MVLKRTFKCFTAVVLFRTDQRLDRCSTAAAVWHWLTAEEAEADAGLVAADVLVVWWWWLEERRLVLVFWLVKTAAVCQSGNSPQIEDFRRSLRVLICWADFLCL